jgi:hypothetical protein
MAHRKDPAAVALAKRKLTSMTADERREAVRIGGLAGGRARAKSLTKAERVAIAKKGRCSPLGQSQEAGK